MSARWQVIVEIAGEQRAHDMHGDVATIGRADDCDIVIGSPVVSSRHADIFLQQDAVQLRQRGRNPTLLDGQPVDGQPIHEGQVLEIGAETPYSVRLWFAQLAAPSSDAGTSPPSPPSAAPEPAALPPSPSQPAAASTLVVGREPGADILLPNPLVSRRHAEITISKGGANLRDLSSGNGTFVNGEKVDRAALTPGDTVRIGPYRLLFDGRELIVQDAGRQVTLVARHLTQRAKDTTILNDVSFACFPGEITVIGGTSGAGKTTLMDALTGLRPAAAGSVLLNGTSLYPNFESQRALMGYVPQSNILHQELPLGRALTYAARLRLPPDTDESEIHMRVQASMHPLDLAPRASLPISLLSGGQQKRASIAMELLTEPSLFFLDEPTSGLDPGLSVRLMRLLRNLADAGKTVIVVSHDPESFEFCDQLVFLAAGGRLAYAGPPREALAHFEVRTYAEMYDRVESESSPEAWQQHFAGSEAGSTLQQRLVRAGAGTSATDPNARATHPPAIPLRHQVEQLTRRYGEVLVRDQRNLFMLLGQAPIIGLPLAMLAKPDALLAFVGAGSAELPGLTSDATKVLLLLAVTSVWLGTINASREVVKEVNIWRREKLAGVAVAPYLGSKVALLSILAAVQNALLLFVVALRVDLPADGLILSPALEFYVTLLLASIASVAAGLALSAASASQERAITLVPLLLIPQIMFAGVIFKLNGLTTVISWLCVSRWAVKALGATAGVPGYEASSGALLGMWLVLGAMTATFLYAAAWLMLRRDRTVAR